MHYSFPTEMKDGIFVKKPEGEYGLSEDHFVIDCVCGVKKGSRFKDSDLEEVIQNRPRKVYKLEQHTFYLSTAILANMLDMDHREEIGDSPLIIICNNCEQEFPLTWETYHKLRQEIYSQKHIAKN